MTSRIFLPWMPPASLISRALISRPILTWMPHPAMGPLKVLMGADDDLGVRHPLLGHEGSRTAPGTRTATNMLNISSFS